MRAAVAVAFVLLTAGSAQAVGSVTEQANRVADDAAAALPRSGTPFAFRVTAELPDAPRGQALRQALEAELLTILRERALPADLLDRSEGLDVGAAAALAAARGYDAHLEVRVSRRSQTLTFRITAFRSTRRRARQLSSSTRTIPLDAHLRSYLGSLPRVDERNVVARRLALPGRGYVAIAAGDIDADGRAEIALVRPDRVDVIRLGAGSRSTYRAERVGSAPLDELRLASARSRRPVATVTVDGTAFVGRTSDHAGSFAVRVESGAVTARSAVDCAEDLYPLADACARRVAGRDFFHAELRQRGASSAPPAPSGFYARVARTLRTTRGADVRFEAVVTPRGRLAARVGETRTGAAGYGAALALADLEQDGHVELLTSSAVELGQQDRLVLLRIRDDGALVAVWTSDEIDGSVLITGSGDVDGDGLEELLAIEEPPAGARRPARLWVVQ